MSKPELGSIGIWSAELRFGDEAETSAAAAEIEELGFGTVWIPGGFDGNILADVERLLNSTKHIGIATGIINLWKHQPEDVAAWFNQLDAERQSRLMLGVGISHGPLIGAGYKSPLSTTRQFVETLRAGGIPQQNLCLAALGPKMLQLSGELTAGAHPYLTSPEHTQSARDILGPVKLLAPEQGVILDDDPATARQKARDAIKIYVALPNYCNNWLRMGYTEKDIETLSDNLIDGLFAWGNSGIVDRIKAHYKSGADHVCLQVIQGAVDPEAITADVGALMCAIRQLAEYFDSSVQSDLSAFHSSNQAAKKPIKPRC